jgi:hypothetical protein
VSRYNQQHLRLHTGQRHGPRAPTTHLVMIFSCGSRHQPQAPDHRSMELPLKHPHHWYEMFFFDTWLVWITCLSCPMISCTMFASCFVWLDFGLSESPCPSFSAYIGYALAIVGGC